MQDENFSYKKYYQRGSREIEHTLLSCKMEYRRGGLTLIFSIPRIKELHLHQFACHVNPFFLASYIYGLSEMQNKDLPTIRHF